MKALIIGASGMLGYAVSKYFRSHNHQVKELTRNDFDIAKDDHQVILPLIETVDAVVNCAGVIKPRLNTMTPEEVIRVNGVFPWNLAKMCNLYKVKCIHLTTDCVFSGLKGNYHENDLVDAQDLYGLSKATGDTNLAMTIRTSIIGEEKNQARSLLSWVISQKGKQVDGYINHIWNGLTTTHLAQLINRILSHDYYQPGVFHLFSPTTISKDKLLQLISDIYKLNLKVNPIMVATKIDRSLCSIKPLCHQVVTKTLKQQLIEMKSFFNS